MIIALDGPAGSGKSTIAKSLAKELSIEYLDTGAMYRAITLHLLTNEVDLEDETQVLKNIENITINVEGEKTFLNNSDVSSKIRDERVNCNISKVASLASVRNKLVSLQQEIGKNKDMILDGRDIATVVFPNADYKFYIDASSDVRARRRVMQNQELGINESFETIKESIERRDHLDKTREIGPLKCAKDAIVIDTSNLDLVATIDLIKTKMGAK